MAKPALGRGLGALLGASTAVEAASAPAPRTEQGVQRVPWSRLSPSPLQPRRDFTPESLEELAASIQKQGILQPLIVRGTPDRYEIIAGERRFRAAQLAGLTEVPIIVRDASDREVLQFMLIENLQRENLNPIEEALGFSELVERFQLTQEEVAAQVGRSRASVANALRLLKLPTEVREHLRHNRLSVGHAKVLLGIADPDLMRATASRVVNDQLSVRQLELFMAQSTAVPRAGSRNSPAATDVHIADLERRLQQRLATKVTLRYRQGRGSLELRFYSDADLERLLEALGVRPE